MSSLALLADIVDRLARELDMARDAIAEMQAEQQDDRGPPLPLPEPKSDRRVH